MCEDRAGCEEGCGVVDGCVGGGGEEAACEGDFGGVFGDVCLDVCGWVCGCGEGPELGEEGVCAGDGEAGGYYGQDLGARRVERVDVRDCGFCRGDGGLCGLVDVVRWTGLGVVHAHASDQGALSAGVADGR